MHIQLSRAVILPFDVSCPAAVRGCRSLKPPQCGHVTVPAPLQYCTHTARGETDSGRYRQGNGWCSQLLSRHTTKTSSWLWTHKIICCRCCLQVGLLTAPACWGCGGVGLLPLLLCCCWVICLCTHMGAMLATDAASLFNCSQPVEWYQPTGKTSHSSCLITWHLCTSIEG